MYLILRGGVFNLPTNTYYIITASTRKRIHSSSYAFPRSFNSFTGYTQSKQGGSNMNNGEKFEKQSISKGDIISLNELLFTSNRDYLVRNNNQHVMYSFYC